MYIWSYKVLFSDFNNFLFRDVFDCCVIIVRVLNVFKIKVYL